MGKVGGRRNFGYGKKMPWAAKNALDDRYGQGRFATKATHLERWAKFVSYLQGAGINDARNISVDHLVAYGEILKHEVQAARMQVAYAQNILSSVNVVLEAIRGDRQVGVLPAKVVGNRTSVRTKAPVSLDRDKLNKVIERLSGEEGSQVVIVARLARELGVRFREASLLDARQAAKQAEKLGRINITEGTKGGRGREVDRWVPVSPRAKEVLIDALRIQQDRRNLIPPEMTFKQWKNHAYHSWERAADKIALRGFHDLRAAYACERYKQITGKDAPVVIGRRDVDKVSDQAARRIISSELGHGRIEIVAAYIGSSR